MLAALSEVLNQLTNRHRRGSHLVLLFDYDGTLVPLVDIPSLARLPLLARQAIESLSAFDRVQIGILSGRELAELKRMVGIDGLFFAGTSGLEFEFRGQTVKHPRAAEFRPMLARLTADIQDLLLKFPGAWLEVKPAGVTLHYRKLNDADIQTLRAQVAALVAPHQDDLHVVDGSMSLEVTPNVGWNKGTSARMILDSLGTVDSTILYAGDSANDLSAFDVVRDEGGVTIGVGPEAPHTARIMLKHPKELIDFLITLSKMLPSLHEAPLAG